MIGATPLILRGRHLPVEDVRACLAVPRWVAEVLAGAPYADAAALLAAAQAAADPLRADEVDAALADHPRIGQQHDGQGRSAAFSRSEQASADADDPQLAAALADGNTRYEARFGRIFLVRAAGRTRAEILAELNRRLALDDATELAEVGTALLEIARLRLARLVEQAPAAVTFSTHVLDAVTGTPAAGVHVRLQALADGGTEVAAGVTDADGRVRPLGAGSLPTGRYRIVLDTGAWFAARGVDAFWPEVALTVEATGAPSHLHVPVLLSPFAYSTYRGS